MYSSSKRHPDDHKQSLIDFDLALILTPMLLLGITAGKALDSMTLLYLHFVGVTALACPAMHMLHDINSCQPCQPNQLCC